MPKRDIHLVIGADPHCGAKSGLTPARYQSRESPPYAAPMWAWYRKTAREIGPVDLSIWNGDLVDGEGKKGTLDIFETDVRIQAQIAAECIREIPAKRTMLTYGTPFHTAGTHSYEDMVADILSAEIRDTLYLELNGVRFSFRHVVGTSGTPYGQPTMLGKALVNDLIQAITGGQESADWVVRSHAHIACKVGIDGREARITPCLQAPDGILGRRLTTWYYHIGLIELWVRADGRVEERAHLLPLEIVRKREWIKG